MTLKMTPVDFTPEGKPRDEQLRDATQAFAEKEFGDKLDFAYYARVWSVQTVNEAGETTVIGLLGVRNAIDVCMFHVVPPSLDKEGLKIAEQARDLMFIRGHGYLADLGNTGHTVMVYVAAGAQRYWRRFLKKIGARPADRFEVTI